jgi:hypothetical protein
MMRPNPFILPISTPCWAGIGYIYGKITETSPKMCALIFAISEIADVALFAAVAFSGCAQGKTIRDVYPYTGLAVNTITILAMYQFNLISQMGVIALTGLSLVHFVSRSTAPLITYE